MDENMKIGYARVSTDDQRMDLQRDALTAAGCEKVFTDTASGAKAARPGLAEALAFARKGDVLVVWRLDRLGRSLPELVKVVGELEAAGVGFESVTERIETSSAAGRLVFHVFAALAEFERRLIVERTHAGLEAARARGRKGGRPAAGKGRGDTGNGDRQSVGVGDMQGAQDRAQHALQVRARDEGRADRW